MCTIILALNVVADAPLIVAANRDELLDRPSERPSWHGDDLIYAPRDLLRGGTWIGVNERGVFVALTNRADVKSERDKLSRGRLVRDALKMAGTARSAAACASLGLIPDAINGYNLVAIDRNEAYLVRNDRRHVVTERLADGLHVIANLGVLRNDDRVELAPRRVRGIRENLYGFDTRACIKNALTLHDDGLDAVCVHEPERNYGTKSSTYLEVDSAWSRFSYAHREGPACGGPFGDPISIPIAPK